VDAARCVRQSGGCELDPGVEAWIKEHCGPHCYGEQDEYGTDLWLIRENLKLTPDERLFQGDRATAQMRELIEHGRRHRAQHASSVR
jgi:hypothetical protein